jgi:hypothetical protein
MRWVDRNEVSVPLSLDGPNSAGAREKSRAAQHIQDNPGESFDFRIYKEPDVADALKTLFRGKCAYCEGEIKAVQPTDIEHFRPKGRVMNCPGHPGYWCCIDCNRQRYQDVPDSEHAVLGGVVGDQYNLGKADAFPILGLAYALCETDDHDAEDAALIDPTRRDPKNHLVWRLEGDLSLVGPRSRDGNLDPYGLHSCNTFGLNRFELVQSRTERFREIKTHLAFIESTLDRALRLPEPFSSEQRDEAMEAFNALYRYAEADKAYSAAVESMLDAEAERLQAKYEALQNAITW